MLGSYDFCAHYEWTFAWLERQGGDSLVREYWEAAISGDAQIHARNLIFSKGFRGMRDYWAHTLEEEAAGYTVTEKPGLYRIDMYGCPSKGFLNRNHLEGYSDYCDHCIGWIGPMLGDAGFKAEHEHNHRGQCWWEIRKSDDPTEVSLPGEIPENKDIRARKDWTGREHHRFTNTLDSRRTFLKLQGEIVLYADGNSGDGVSKGLASALKEVTGAEPRLVDATKPLTSEDVANAALVVLYHSQTTPDAVTKSTLEEWVKKGKPLLLVHTALEAYRDWAEYKFWAGRVGILRKSGRSSEDACLSGISTGWTQGPRRLPTDEIFTEFDEISACRDLLAVETASGKYPMAWLSEKHPNVGVWASGHSEASWRSSSLREGVAMVVDLLLGKNS